MKILKKLFPLSWLTHEKDIGSLVAGILWYVVVIFGYFSLSTLLGLLLGDLVAWLLGIWGIGVGLYSSMGMVLAVLVYLGILK